MSIKRALKKESSKRKRGIILSLLIMVLMIYFVYVLNQNKILTGFESYFSYIYVVVICIMLLINISKIVAEDRISFEIKRDVLKITGGYFFKSYNIPLDKILYVDVKEDEKDFDLILILKKSNRKKYRDFNKYFVARHKEYEDILKFLSHTYGDEIKFSYINIKRSGARKYYLLYILYKAGYNIDFSRKAIGYIKKFTEEYKV